jgi:hypothetical protein
MTYPIPRSPPGGRRDKNDGRGQDHDRDDNQHQASHPARRELATRIRLVRKFASAEPITRRSARRAAHNRLIVSH